MKKLRNILIFTGLLPMILQAQISLSPSVIVSAGDYYESTSMSISWSMGELATVSLEGNNILLTQGFQQPYDIGVGIKNNRVSWNILVYPNPADDELSIVFGNRTPDDFIIEVRDLTGRLFKQQLYKQVNKGEIIILNLNTLMKGVYFLKIFSTDKKRVQVTSILKL